MIKTDKIGMKEQLKKATICLGGIAMILSVYTALFVLVAQIWKRLRKNVHVLAVSY